MKSAKSTLNISNTIWTIIVLLILKVRKVFFIWTKHITTASKGPSLFWASNCSERSKEQFMGQKSLCPSRETPRNGQIFVLPAHKKMTLQTFGISETLVFIFLCDHITYIFCFIVFYCFWSSWSYLDHDLCKSIFRPQPVILSSTNNVEKTQ